jgi:hypothetical protein
MAVDLFSIVLGAARRCLVVEKMNEISGTRAKDNIIHAANFDNIIPLGMPILAQKQIYRGGTTGQNSPKKAREFPDALSTPGTCPVMQILHNGKPLRPFSREKELAKSAQPLALHRFHVGETNFLLKAAACRLGSCSFSPSH